MLLATFHQDTESLMTNLLKQAKGAAEVKRIQCVLFGARGLKSEEIAPMVNFNHGYVKQIWSEYRQKGSQALLGENRGRARSRAHLSLDEEKDFLQPFIEKAIAKSKQLAKPLKVMFADEARFGRIAEPKRCWSPPHIRPIVPKQLIREYEYVYGAFSPLDGVADTLILPNMFSQTMNLFLKEIGQRHQDEYILMIVDGASNHRANQLNIPDN